MAFVHFIVWLYETQIKSLRQLNFSLSLEKEPLRRIHTTIFTVVEATSTYNVILGRLVMSTFKAVASTYHQKIEFPMSGRVREV